MAADSDGEPEVGFTPPSPFLTTHDKVVSVYGTTACNHLADRKGGSQLGKYSSTEEENDLIQTVFTCHGNLYDPEFPEQFAALLERLSTILCTGKDVLMHRVKKIEPWNSVRVTLTIPREAATRLRALAAAGDQALQSLGILSVQVDGDQVISLRLATRFGGEPQEIVLRTNPQENSSTLLPGTTVPSMPFVSSASFSSPGFTEPSTSGMTVMGPPAPTVSALLNAVVASSSSSLGNFPTPSSSSKSSIVTSSAAISTPSSTLATSSAAILSSAFRSPNVVAPATSSAIPSPPASKSNLGPSPYPFTSMKHSAQTNLGRESVHHNFTAPQPPPPYGSKSFPRGASPLQKPITSSGKPSLPPTPIQQSLSDTNTVSMSSPLLVNLLQTDGKDLDASTGVTTGFSPGQPHRPPRPNHHHHHMSRPPRPNKISSNLMIPSSPPSTAIPPRGVSSRVPFHRFPHAPSSPSPTAVTPLRSPVTSSANQPSNALSSITSKDHPLPPPSTKHRSVIHGYSQFTALSSKPCSSNELSDKSEEKKTTDGKKLIVNPLTGELEPMPSESSESEEDTGKEDPFFYPPSPSSRIFPDDDMVSRKGLVDGLDPSYEPERAVNCLNPPESGASNNRKPRTTEKIKLRFMVDKSSEQQLPTTQAAASAYKVDVSFVNAPSHAIGTSFVSNSASRKPQPIGSTTSGVGSGIPTLPVGPLPTTYNAVNSNNGNGIAVGDHPANVGHGHVPQITTSPGSEEPRVPPLHISLRGRNATVVSNKKKSPHWPPDEELYMKFAKKRLKDGRDSVAIGNCELTNSQPRPKRVKMRRLAASIGQSSPPPPTSPSGLVPTVLNDLGENSIKLKLPVTPPITEFSDEKLSKKRKDAKKVRNNMRHSDPALHIDLNVDSSKLTLKMDSEEWISRTLKEETLRQSGSLDEEPDTSERVVMHDCEVGDSGSAVDRLIPSGSCSDDMTSLGDDCLATKDQCIPEQSIERTTNMTFKTSTNYELSDLLRRKSLENTLKPDGVKLLGSNLLELSEQLQLQHDEVEAAATEVAVRKPQEIGGKIKSELSSKIDRVSGKLKNDLLKDGSAKKKVDDPIGKGPKTGARMKCATKLDLDDSPSFGRIKRRYSGDQSTSESQAQRIKRSSSSDQAVGASPKPTINRKVRKDSVIDRLRKDKLSKVLAITNTTTKVSDINNKKVQLNRITVANPSFSKQVLTPTPSTALVPQQSIDMNKHAHPPSPPCTVDNELDAVVTTTSDTMSTSMDRVGTDPTPTSSTGSDKQQKPLDAGGGNSSVSTSGSGNGGEGNTQGEDSGIESMDALSEKSPNQGESPCRKDESSSTVASCKELIDNTKKGQNHDRLEEMEESIKDVESNNSCLSMRTANDSNNSTTVETPLAPSVPCDDLSESSKTKTNAIYDNVTSSSTSIEPTNNPPLPTKPLSPSPSPTSETSTKVPPVTDASADLVGSFETKIREAFQRHDDDNATPREGLAAKILDSTIHDSLAEGENGKDWIKEHSPSLEDLEGFRVNPPLYTYAKREESLSPSPTQSSDSGKNHIDGKEDGIEEEASKVSMSSTSTKVANDNSAATGRNLRNNKSLLEQLLIEIPEDTRRTRSWHKLSSSPGGTPKSSPRPSSPNIARASPRTASGNSNSKLSPTLRSSSTANATTSSATTTALNTKRPTKRKCSENAMELIKACIDENKPHGRQQPNASTASTNSSAGWKRGDVDSSDDEPLSDLARSREHSVEQEVKGTLLLKTKSRNALADDEIRNNNRISMKTNETPTRRSVRQTQGSISNSKTSIKAASCGGASEARAVRSTRSAVTLDSNMDSSNSKRRRISRDSK